MWNPRSTNPIPQGSLIGLAVQLAVLLVQLVVQLAVLLVQLVVQLAVLLVQ